MCSKRKKQTKQNNSFTLTSHNFCISTPIPKLQNFKLDEMNPHLIQLPKLSMMLEVPTIGPQTLHVRDMDFIISFHNFIFFTYPYFLTLNMTLNIIHCVHCKQKLGSFFMWNPIGVWCNNPTSAVLIMDKCIF